MSEILEIFPNSRQVSSAREDHAVFPFPSANSSAPTAEPNLDRGSVAPLIKRLLDALNAQQISYCHWKSNWKLNRWLTGAGDLDLLIDRADAHRFLAVVHGLGFKQAEPTADRQVPGIHNFYGFDREVDRFIHLHVHYQIVVGNDLTKNYHLPIENLLLQNSVRTDWLPIPPVEFEFIIFVIRMVLKQSLLENASRSILNRKKAATAIQRELDELDSSVDRARVANLLPQIAAGIDHKFFEVCVRALRSGSGWTRMKVRR